MLIQEPTIDKPIDGIKHTDREALPGSAASTP